LGPGAAGGKHGEGAGKGNFPSQGQARGGAHEILFGDAHVKKPVLEDFGEMVGLGGAGKIRVQHHDQGVFGPQLGQGLTVFDSGALFGRQIMPQLIIF
jgi:hypothetical protein